MIGLRSRRFGESIASMSRSFDDNVRRFLEQIGHGFEKDEASGLYAPISKTPILQQSTHTGRDKPLHVDVRRDWKVIALQTVISLLTLALLYFTVRYTKKQWLETN